MNRASLAAALSRREKGDLPVSVIEQSSTFGDKEHDEANGNGDPRGNGGDANLRDGGEMTFEPLYKIYDKRYMVYFDRAE